MWKDVDRVGFVMVVLLLTGMGALAFGAVYFTMQVIASTEAIFRHLR